MTDNYDQLALSWVRKEINNTLEQARQGLETFAEDHQDQTQIQFCINSLHQVQGTLQMLGFNGAARLASEMETLAKILANETQSISESSFEVLMRAMMQMPGYLERVESGQKDIPVVLLPLINELRAASSLGPVKENEFFTADTGGVEPPKPNDQVTQQEKTTSFQENSRKLRAHFQKGLAGVIRVQNVKESLARIHKVLLRLEALTEGRAVAKLWWVADGFIFSIAERGVYKEKDVHILLGQVDKQIKRLSDLGEAALDDEIPSELLSKLLYFVARSKSKNSRVTRLKKEFNLEESLAESETVKKQQQQLARPDSSAMANVITAIGEELASVKDQLDLFVRAKAKEPSQLQSLSDSLLRIADTLTILELPIPRDVIREQIKTLQKSIEFDKMPDDSAIMDLAGALLFVDANLNNFDLERFTSDEDTEERNVEISERHSKDSQVDDATIALVGVARKNLQLAKDGMINYIASSFNESELESVPQLLSEVLGAMRIVEFGDAAEILQVAESFVKERLIDISQEPSEKHLDALADIITSVDYYLEGTEDGTNKSIVSILRSAKSSQDILVAALKEPKVERVVEDISTTKELPGSQNKMADVIPINQSSAEKEVDESLIDDEVLEIFLEEAEEEIEVIEKNLPIWINDSNSQEALSTMRRSFHTLKGSGRLVGATTIGELSWAVEDMLNKVIEESIPAESPAHAVLNNALTKLPVLVKEFSENIQHQGNDIDELIARANHVSSGANLSDFVFEAELETKQNTQGEVIPTLSQPVETSTEEESIDPVLLEIFVAEAEVHLKAIDEFIATIPSGSSVAVTDSLIRALHTLKGSAHMAKVDAIAQITGPLEKYARITKGSGRRFEGDVIEILVDSSQFLSNVVEKLQNSQPIDNNKFSSLVNRISVLNSEKLKDDEKEGSLQQRDQQLVSIFLTEGSDILQEVSTLLDALKASPGEQSLTDKISSEFHAFRRGCEMIGIQDIQNFAMTCESVSHIVNIDDDSNKEYQRLLNAGVEMLTQMLSRLVSEEDIVLPVALNDEMQSWVAEASREEAPEEMDQELVELFVEEADELIESASSLLVRWNDNLNSEDITSELRRIYHTFKGSSRMAGAMNIGDLAYMTEEIFNAKLDARKDIISSDFQLVSMATNKLVEMVDVLRGFRWPPAATVEISQLENYLRPDSDAIKITVGAVSEEVVAKEIVSVEAPVVEEVTTEEPIVEEVTTEEPVVEEITIEDMLKGETIAEYLSAEVPLLEDSISQQSLIDNMVIEKTLEDKVAIDANIEDEIVEVEESPVIDTIKQKVAEEVIDDTDNKATNQNVEQTYRAESNDAVVTEDTIAPAAPVVASGNVYPIDLDEDGLEVLEIYLEEADELLIALDESLHLWSEENANADALDTMQRTLHTFKGGARLADLVVLGDLTHEMETYFEKVNDGTMQVKASHVSHMLKGYDVIEGLVTEVKEKNQMTLPEEYFLNLKKIIAGEDIEDSADDTSVVQELLNEQTIEAEPEKTESSDKETTAQIVSFEERKQKQEAERKPAAVVDTVRVNANQLENLVNLAGETSIFRSRLEQQMTVLRYNLDEMSSTVERLKEQLRNLDIETEAQISYRREISGGIEYDDFDPLEMDRYTRQQELTRSLGESAVDLMNLKETLDSLTSDSETLLLQQGRVNTEMQESLMQTRMMPFESLVPRLRRMVRQISTELGKTIELSISADGEMDRSVLERMIAPLEHMLRNAMDHGIEPPRERKEASKPETGKIAISLYREGSEVFIKIKDDGRGLNLDAIRKKAIERGLITKETELNNHELHQLVLEAGFSTAEKVTQISGRGVGMDVVNSEIKQMGGVIEIDSVNGLGSTFTVRLPFTVSVNHALMVQIGEDVYAIPLSNIEGIVRVSPFELEEYYSNVDTKFAYAGIDYTMYYLGQMLDHHTKASLAGVSQPLPVLLLHGADHPTALQVDDLLGSREVVVKSVGSQLSSVSGVSGATIQGDGRVVLILDMPALIRRVDARIIDHDFVQEIVEEEKMPTIMVVDDSITVRKVTTRLLERNDFEVITAKDGVDAVTILADTVPDVMLLDIEMPRMDGFELATIIRHDQRLKGIPIIMITSRTGEKHRERAESIGVNQYMGKPYNEVDLLETINGLLVNKT